MFNIKNINHKPIKEDMIHLGRKNLLYVEKIKRKKTLLFISILAIGLYYINEKTHWITNRTYELKDVSKSSVILFHKMKTQEHVYDFFVHITGHIARKGKDYIELSKFK